MERPLGGDEVVLAVAAVRLAVLAGDLDGGLVGLRAGVAEEDALEVADLAEFRRQLGLRGGQVQVGRVDQRRRLLLDGPDEARVAVAEAVDGDAGQEVQILLALGVVQPRALSAHKRHGQAGVGVHDVGVVQRLDLRGV